MLPTCRLCSACLFVVLGLLTLPGCGKSGATVKGTLILPPDVKLKDTDTVRVSFRSEDPKSQAYPADFSIADNTFIAGGPGKKSVPAGKYKIAVQLSPYAGTEENDKRSALFDRINDTFDSANSKLTYEVASDATQSITIDLTKGTVTKN